MKKILLFTFVIIALSACGNSDEKEDIMDNANHEGAVETQISVEHIDDQSDVIVTTHKIWIKGTQHKTVEKRDTIPSLGNFSETNDNGEQIAGKKDYELYITIK